MIEYPAEVAEFQEKKIWTRGHPFTVTPFLTDHSAVDAYILLIQVEGKRILYSGDFRVHGRKGALVSRFMSASPPAIDVLLLEGTTDKPG